MQFIDLKSRHKLIGDKINIRLQKVMDHGQFILGPEVLVLEQKLAEYTGSKHCVTVSSGTDSLLIAIMALDIGEGDEVITVPYTWISTAEVIALLGAKPVFVDIRPDTWNMDEAQLEAAITAKTKAIIPVSIYGQCPDIDAINAIAEKYNLAVIEDAAQSFGATYKGKNPAIFQPSAVPLFFRPNHSVVMEMEELSLQMMMSWLKSSAGFACMDRNASIITQSLASMVAWILSKLLFYLKFLMFSLTRS